jgi:hypothetical protein
MRGFFGNPCNLSLGLMKDNPQFLRAAADYLDQDRELRLRSWRAEAGGGSGRVDITTLSEVNLQGKYDSRCAAPSGPTRGWRGSPIEFG